MKKHHGFALAYSVAAVPTGFCAAFYWPNGISLIAGVAAAWCIGGGLMWLIRACRDMAEARPGREAERLADVQRSAPH